MLREALIKLASEKPELRKDIVPILRAGSERGMPTQEDEDLKAMREEIKRINQDLPALKRELQQLGLKKLEVEPANADRESGAEIIYNGKKGDATLFLFIEAEKGKRWYRVVGKDWDSDAFEYHGSDALNKAKAKFVALATKYDK